MLAKELKIKTLKKQREFIKEQLSHGDVRRDGDTAYRYVGHIYPEVIAYFESEGFSVKKVESDLMTALTKGMPTYIFVVGDVKLTEEELQAAEAYETDADDDDSDDDVPDFIAALLGGRGLM